MPEVPEPGSVLSRRALNRSLIARQLLLERASLTAAQAIDHLVGMQAQVPLAPYVGLWTRLEGFDPDELAGMLTRREAVRTVVMRSTIHLVSAEDCLVLRPVVQPVITRSLGSNFRRRLEGLDLGPVILEGRALVEASPRTFAELGEALGVTRPGRDPLALAMVVRTHVPLVQVPPRGLWGQGGLARHTAAEVWLGRPLAGSVAPDAMIERYLRAFGPATLQDIQVWSGLPGLRAVVDRLRPRLVGFRDEGGRELFDVPGAPHPDPATPVPPRFLPEFDNALLSHAERGRIIAGDHRGRIMTRGALLVDGFARGTWQIRRAAREATLTIELFAPLKAGERQAVEAEAEQLLAFAAPEAASRRLTILPG